jgi:hypothetical protein
LLIAIFMVYSEVRDTQGKTTAHILKIVEKSMGHEISSDLPTVCTYFQPFESARKDEFRAVVKLWEESWGRQGWNTRVLTERDAHKYPGFNELKESFRTLPTVNAESFEMACYIRWVAMVVSGCRWMADIDLINFGFPPQRPWHGPVLYSFGGLMPALVTGSTAAFQAVVDTLTEVALNNETVVATLKGKPHVSDMLIFAKRTHLYLPLSFPLYSTVAKSLESSPLLHFSFDDAIALRKTSKLELIHDSRKLTTDSESTGSAPTVCTYTPGPDAGPAAAAEWEETYPAWKESWTAQGWATQVLTQADAARHPRFPELLEKFAKLAAAAADGDAGSDAAAGTWRYVRWVAAVTAGCRWLCDSDLVNLGFPPQAPWHGPVLYSFDGPQPTLVTGSPAAFQSVLDALEEAAAAAAEGRLRLPPTATDDGRPVAADARVLGGRPGLFLDTYFPMNVTGAAARASSVLLHLDAADAAGMRVSRAELLAKTRPFAPDGDTRPLAA